MRDEVRAVLSNIASLREMSVSAVAGELIEQALELAEDKYFSELAESRYKRGQKTVSHEDLWHDI